MTTVGPGIALCTALHISLGLKQAQSVPSLHVCQGGVLQADMQPQAAREHEPTSPAMLAAYTSISVLCSGS